MHDGAHVGTFGYAGFYSFEPTKPVNTYGGGMVVSRDHSLISRVQAHNRSQPENLTGFLAKASTVKREQALFKSGLAFPVLAALSMPGLRGPVNRLYRSRQAVPAGAARYTALQAHLGLRKLATLEHRIARRTALVEEYHAQLASALPLQQCAANQRSTWYFLTATLPHAAKNTRAALLWRGVDAAVEDEVMDDCASLYRQPNCPNAMTLFNNNLVLPLSDTMQAREVQLVVGKLKRLFHATKAD
jgi:dTDP-4-amino-4,6-dideoxygalactose transaminase